MKKILLLLIILSLFLTACEKPEICGDGVCQTNEDYNSCSRDCPNCEDKDICTKDFFNYPSNLCVNQKISLCCGDNVCESTENNTNCAVDCEGCNDNNECTQDLFVNNKCEYKEITPCCKNGVCEEGEDQNNCPYDCDSTIELCDSSRKCPVLIPEEFTIKSGIEGYDFLGYNYSNKFFVTSFGGGNSSYINISYKKQDQIFYLEVYEKRYDLYVQYYLKEKYIPTYDFENYNIHHDSNRDTYLYWTTDTWFFLMYLKKGQSIPKEIIKTYIDLHRPVKEEEDTSNCCYTTCIEQCSSAFLDEIELYQYVSSKSASNLGIPINATYIKGYEASYYRKEEDADDIVTVGVYTYDSTREKLSIDLENYVDSLEDDGYTAAISSKKLIYYNADNVELGKSYAWVHDNKIITVSSSPNSFIQIEYSAKYPSDYEAS